jgi:4a-hydroxytetrahydrobiopterin dehydratase
MAVLSNEEVDAALPGLAGWELPDRAEAADHHPDIDIRWRTVTFVLSTHSQGGITQNDLALAREIDEIVGQ